MPQAAKSQRDPLNSCQQGSRLLLSRAENTLGIAFRVLLRKPLHSRETAKPQNRRKGRKSKCGGMSTSPPQPAPPSTPPSSSLAEQSQQNGTSPSLAAPPGHLGAAPSHGVQPSIPPHSLHGPNNPLPPPGMPMSKFITYA